MIATYEKANTKFPKDNWVLREKGLLHIWNGEIEKGKTIFKKLLLELGDKFYVWSEFSTCFNDNLKLKIAMLCKAIQLEKNEDFLGDVRLQLSNALIGAGLLENAFVELELYKTHRVEKGWKLSDTYEELKTRVKDISTSSLNGNTLLYQEFIPIAEEFVYQDISWTEVVLTDLWKNDNNAEKCNFSNGEDVNFSISKKRFKELRNVQIGNVFNFKLLETLKEGERRRRRVRKFSSRKIQRKSNLNYSPLMIKVSSKSNWSILKDEHAIIDYINVDKNVIHGITTKNETIFFKEDIRKYQQGDFVRGKRLKTERKEKIIIELKNISKSTWDDSISFFPIYKSVIDHVNFNKEIFHFVADINTDGIIRFHETKLKLQAGSIIEIRMVQKKNNKTGRMVNRILEINESAELSHNLIKEVKGELSLNYKGGISSEPDFGFVKDIYVPKNILKKNHVVFDCMVKAKAIFSNGKWRIFELKEV